jgi:hypothetical protein
MGLPWVRIDTNMPSHDKILALLSDPSPKKWQAAFSWSCSIAWSGGQSTDGFVPKVALGFVHGTPATARLLEKYRLWSEGTAGWHIVNFTERQEMGFVTEMKNEMRRNASEKANCTRWHGPGCWTREKGCSRNNTIPFRTSG